MANIHLMALSHLLCLIKDSHFLLCWPYNLQIKSMGHMMWMLKPRELFMLLVHKVKDTSLLPSLSSVARGLSSFFISIVEAEKNTDFFFVKGNYLDVFQGNKLSNYALIVTNRNSFLCCILFSVSPISARLLLTLLQCLSSFPQTSHNRLDQGARWINATYYSLGKGQRTVISLFWSYFLCKKMNWYCIHWTVSFLLFKLF